MRITKRLCLSGLFLLTSWSIALGQPPCAVPLEADGRQVRNGTQLCLTLKFAGGKLVPDRGQSALVFSDEFARRLRIPRAQAEEQIFGQLKQLLDRLPRPYQLALSTEETAQDAAGTLNDPLTNGLRTADQSWEEYLQQFSEWAAAGTDRQPVHVVFSEEAFAVGGLLESLINAEQTTALAFVDGSYDAELGRLTFSIAAPISDYTDARQAQIVLPGFSGKEPPLVETEAEQRQQNARARRLQKELAPLAGALFCRECIRERLQSYYQRIGLSAGAGGLDELPIITIGNSQAVPFTITVVEAARIAQISLPESILADRSLDKVLYNLLEDDVFRAFLGQRAALVERLTDDPQRPEWKTINYINDLHHPKPRLNLARLQIQQLLLAQLGYVVSFEQGTRGADFYNVILVVQKAEGAGTERANTPEAAPPLADEAGVVKGQEQQEERQTEFVPTAEQGKEIKDKKRFIGGGFEYRPGQGVRFFGLAQQSRLGFPFRDGSLSLKLGGQQGDALGAINYFADYIFFDALHRRLSLQITTASELEADRALSGMLMDERRRGAMARLEFEPFRDRAGSLLRFHAEGRRATVALEPRGGLPDLKQNLTTFELGALYLFETRETENPRRLRLEPRLRFGLGLAAGEPEFTKFVGGGNFHQRLPRRFELDISGRLEFASRDTPLFELPSFGGAEIVRGFRRDDALGRRLWSLQNELWIPLPIDEAATGFKSLLREKVRLAPFIDVGGLYLPRTSSAGTRAGAGLGVRFIYNPIILKLDYAYGFGTAATGGSRGKFYFSVGSNLPF